MKTNKKNIIFISAFAIILFVFLINFNKIKFLFSFVDIKLKDTISSEGTNESFQGIDENPLKDFVLEEKDTELEENTSNKLEGSPKDTQVSQINEQNNDKPVESKAKAFNSIANEYNIRFESLENEFIGSLDSLFQSAYDDYKEGTLSNSRLASKYLNLGSDLEKKSDERFFALVEQMKSELVVNGHPTDITKEIESYYKSYKNSEKQKLLNKVN